ncbi:MAG: amidase [Planctomycetes bacterium]|nr:amidase [Planctomycetota bacterium]
MPADFAFATIRQLAQGLREQRFTAVELAEFFLARLERLGPRYNAVVTVTRARALAEATQADQEFKAGRDRGLLHGIPYGVKDLLATRGIPTTWGAAPFRERIIDDEATVITRLREAGAVLVAKLAMVELAGGLGYRQAHASFSGPGLNPWDVKSWSGGSSSGSGAAVAAGLVPLAIGSETSGSIVTPAAYCGVTGLRPTYGRVSRHGAMALTWSMDKLGPLCRTADDCGLVLNAIAGPDPLDDTSVSRPFQYPEPGAAAGPFKLAILREPTRKPQPEIQQNFATALQVLENLGTIMEIPLPDFPYSAVVGTIINCELTAAFGDLLTTGQVWEMTAPEDRVGLHAASVIPARDYINACRIRRQIQIAVDTAFAGFDAIVVPTGSTVAPPLDREFREYQAPYRGTGLTVAANAAGLPGITLPTGHGERGLPTSLSLVGRAFSENQLLAVASAYQSRTDWHTRHPGE